MKTTPTKELLPVGHPSLSLVLVAAARSYLRAMGTALFAGMLLFAFVIPSLMSSHCSRNDSSAIGLLRSIDAAQRVLRHDLGRARFQDLEELVKVGYLPPHLSSGQHQGFRFRVAVDPELPADRYTATATPLRQGETGEYSYFTDQTGIVRYARAGEPLHKFSCRIGQGRDQE